ncbi:MAG TPA: VWA domain-containing protein [Thermoanaerobaculia bacterium]|nr:VWA domain-containing protein [Thermoanaerobaculia bacterium]
MRKTKVQAFLISFLAGAAFALAWAAAPAAAQEPIQDSFSDSLDVQAVNLHVVVTDRRGNPVKGLTAADFRLLVDGKETPLEYFAEIQGGQAAPPPAQVAAAGEAVPPPPSLETGEEMGNSYLLFVDEYHSDFRLRNEVLRAMAGEVLTTLRPQDRMAVVAYDGRRVRVLSPWTSAGEPLRQLLEKLSSNRGLLSQSALTFRDLDPSAERMLEVYGNNATRAYESLGWDDGGEGSPLDGLGLARLQIHRIRQSVAAASATLRAFSAAPGRKVMLLLSGGWQYDLLGTQFSWENVQLAMTYTGYGEQLLRPLMDTGNLLGFTIYPVHLSYGMAFLPDAGSRTSQALDSGEGVSALLRESVSRTSLAIPAAETGGKVLLPGRNRHLAKVLADTSDYYWLGFTHAGDDRRHEIQVKVRQPKLRVRSRTSFVPLSRVARAAMDMESALMTGHAPGMEPLGVSLGELRKLGAGQVELPVTVRVAVDKITLVPQSGRYFGSLELRIGTLDDDGDRSDAPVLPIEISRPDPPGPGAFIRYDVTLRLRDSPQDVQLVFYDLLSGKSFAERVRVEP